ncbi:hypothetical protein FSP39_004000 [Pinctada imbricata]|uniref:NR LBD domain-containing protein n=1 Tax=Pinctada imbricata TaxID=66713 RepID=A0AA89C0P5_PINIB|nr:hypothetical protein FSP39_004000 [Pinctada imbricata]
MELELTKMVDFVRSIPMFTELSVSDQTALIKSSHFEFWFLAAHKCINPSLRVVVGVRDFHEAEIKGIVRKDFTENLFSVAKSLLALNLTWEEITVVRGIVVTFTDRCELEEPEKVERIQSRLISALRILAKRNKQDPDKRICKIVDRLTALRNMTELTHDIHKDILTWPLMKDYPLALDVLQGAS